MKLHKYKLSQIISNRILVSAGFDFTVTRFISRTPSVPWSGHHSEGYNLNLQHIVVKCLTGQPIGRKRQRRQVGQLSKGLGNDS